MRKLTLTEGVLLGLQIPLAAKALSITIIAVDAFGNANTGCRVLEFTERSLNPETPVANPIDRHLRFVELRATGIEAGLYDLILRCDRGFRGNATVWATHDETLVVVQTTNHIGDDYFGGQPRLTVKIEPPVSGSWVRAMNPYQGMTESALVNAKTGVANFYNITTGKYAIFLLAPGRIICTYELDHAIQGETIELTGDGSCQVKK